MGSNAYLMLRPTLRGWPTNRRARYEYHNMIKHPQAFGKFVRLNLTGEVVEVLECNSTEIIISFKGKKLTMAHHQVSRAAPEEAAVAAKRISG